MKKIYLSYSHHSSDNIDTIKFAERITKDLEELGYSVWMDNQSFNEKGQLIGITPGSSFDVAMEKGIEESDVILFLVTLKAVTEHSVCRKEIAYGNTCHKDSLPVRVSNVKIPIMVCDISYIDFYGGFSKEGDLDANKYKKVLQDIDKALKDFEKHKNAKNNKLQMYLLKTRYRPLVVDFVGRKWLFEQCKNWILDKDKKNQLAFLLGGPGTGKSAFLSVLTNDSELVQSVHFCSEDEAPSKRLTNLLLNWSFYLTTQNEDYKAIVEIMDLEKIKENEPTAIFRDLFIEPLRLSKETFCLVADSLDEMEEGEGRKLVNLLKTHISELPKNISFLVSSRIETDIIGETSNYPTFVLSEENNQEDTREYIDFMVKKHQSLLSEEQKEQLLEASEYNFQYLFYWFREYNDSLIDDNHILEFPKALEGILSRIINKKFSSEEDLRFYKQVARPILSLLAASLRPLKDEEIKAITSFDNYDFLDFKNKMESLIPSNNNVFSFYHKSLREFLTNYHKAGKFFIDIESGEEILLNSIISNKKASYLEEFSLVHVQRSLSYSSLKEKAKQYLDKLYKENSEHTLKKLVSVVDQLNAKEFEAIVTYLNNLEYSEDNIFDKNYYFNELISTRKIHLAEKSLPLFYDENTLLYFIGLGDISFTKDENQKAKKYYKKAFEIAQENDKNPLNYRSKKNLIMSYPRIAGILSKEDKTSEARSYYQKALELAKENDKDFPSYESKRHLSTAYGNLANVLSQEYKISEAISYYQKALELDIENLELFSSYESKRNLSVSYSNLASVLLKEDKISEAKQYFQLALSLAQEIFVLFPSYESKRGLIITYNDVAGIFLKEDKRNEAKEYFQSALKLAQENVRLFPSYESKRDLSLSYNEIADSLLKEDKIREAKEYFQLALKLSQENAQLFFNHQSRRDLSLSYNRIADVLLIENKISEAKEYFQLALETDQKSAQLFPGQLSRINLSLSYNNLATVFLIEDKISEAKEYFQLALNIVRENTILFPSYENKRNLSAAYNNFATVLLKEDKISEAKEYFQLALKLSQENAKLFLNYETKRAMGFSYNKIADIFLKEGKKDEAEEYYQLALKLSQENAKILPNYESKRGLSIAYGDIANIFLEKGKKDEAKEYYRKALNIFKENVELFPSYKSKRELSICYNRIANIFVKENKISEAKKYSQLALKLSQENAELFPCYESKQDLLFIYNRLVRFCSIENNPKMAIYYNSLIKKLKNTN